jgi:hypothetical protein
MHRHRDTTTFDILDDSDEGFSVWLPLVDIDADEGGSVLIVNRSAIPKHCQAFAGLDFPPECQEVRTFL